MSGHGKGPNHHERFKAPMMEQRSEEYPASAVAETVANVGSAPTVNVVASFQEQSLVEDRLNQIVEELKAEALSYAKAFALQYSLEEATARTIILASVAKRFLLAASSQQLNKDDLLATSDEKPQHDGEVKP